MDEKELLQDILRWMKDAAYESLFLDWAEDQGHDRIHMENAMTDLKE